MFHVVTRRFIHSDSSYYWTCNLTVNFRGILYRSFRNQTGKFISFLQFLLVHHGSHASPHIEMQSVCVRWPRSQCVSGDLDGKASGPSRPIHRSGYFWFEYCITYRMRCGSAPSCCGCIPNLVITGTYCKRRSSWYCKTRYGKHKVVPVL